MEQLKIKEKKKIPVVIAGIRQNCYVLDTREHIIKNPRPALVQKKVPVLKRQELKNGFTEGIVLEDYPINSESVSSYIDSSDYRNDPMQAIANAPKRVNLGDISQVQEFVKNEPVHATKQYADILHKVADYFADIAKNGNQSQSKTATQANTSNQAKTATEVKNG